MVNKVDCDYSLEEENKVPRQTAFDYESLEIRSDVGKPEELYFGSLLDDTSNLEDWKLSSDDVIRIVEKLVVGMVARRTQPASSMFAGYTYIGQMLTHDIVEPINGSARPNYTSHLDLGCMYPDLIWNPKGESLNDDPDGTICKTGKFRMGFASGSKKGDKNDLLRSERRALIPEPRQDENVLISQMHLLWQRIHNIAVDKLWSLTPGCGQAYYYNHARAFVTLIFQRVIVDDYLYHLLDPKVFRTSITDGMSYLIKSFHGASSAHGAPKKLPLEFSHAAFRVGHAMVRDEYYLNDETANGVKFLLLARPNRSKKICRTHVIDWNRFFHTSKVILGKRNRAARLGLRIMEDLEGNDSFQRKSRTEVFGHDLYRKNMEKVVSDDPANPILKVIRNIAVSDMKASRRVLTADKVLTLIARNTQVGADIPHDDTDNTRFHYQSLSGLLNITNANLPFLKTYYNVSYARFFGDAPLSDGEKVSLSNTPFWLFSLRECDGTPDTVIQTSTGNIYLEAKSKLQDSLGPVSSLVIAEVVRESIRTSKISIYNSESTIRNQLGCLSEEYNRMVSEAKRMNFASILEKFGI